MADGMIIPRRLSVHDEDYDHNLGKSLTVYLDGIEQREVIGYDMDAGTILTFDKDEAGVKVVDESETAVRTKTLYGTVTVTREAGGGSKV